MHRSKAAPPGARVPLIVFVAALAAGALIVLQVHHGHEAAKHASRSLVAPPAPAARDARAR